MMMQVPPFAYNYLSNRYRPTSQTEVDQSNVIIHNMIYRYINIYIRFEVDDLAMDILGILHYNSLIILI